MPVWTWIPTCAMFTAVVWLLLELYFGFPNFYDRLVTRLRRHGQGWKAQRSAKSMVGTLKPFVGRSVADEAEEWLRSESTAEE